RKPEFHRDLFLPFYDKYLKGLKTSWDERPRVSYQVHNTGAVRAFEQWPPPATRKARFFLAKGPTGTVKSLNDGALSLSPRAADGGATSYTYPHPSWVFGNVSVGPAGPDPAAARSPSQVSRWSATSNSPVTASSSSTARRLATTWTSSSRCPSSSLNRPRTAPRASSRTTASSPRVGCAPRITASATAGSAPTTFPSTPMPSGRRSSRDRFTSSTSRCCRTPGASPK